MHGLKPTFYALGAAALWALGTVLGRYLARDMRFEHVATLRFAFGLPASAVALLILGTPDFASAHDAFWIGTLALVTGLLALGLYYYGLQRTPAVAASLAELAFPVSAILVGYFKFGQTLTGSQWLGVALTSLVVVLLPARPVEEIEYAPAAGPGLGRGRPRLRRRAARRAAERAGRAAAGGAGRARLAPCGRAAAADRGGLVRARRPRAADGRRGGGRRRGASVGRPSSRGSC